jgi:hypothetical protein
MRPRSRFSLAAIALAVSVASTGCATPGLASGSTEQRFEDRARTQAADLARSLYRGPTDTIDDYARWADAKTQTGAVEVIGFEPFPDAVHGEPFGLLRLRSTIDVGSGDPFIACFETEFDFWGVATAEFGDWDDDRAVAHDVPCPSDAARITPPVDTRPVKVIPDGAEAIVVDVLTTATPDATAADLLAAVNARMPVPTGERETAFPADLAIVDDEIGFAMGDADDCLLVKRDDEGVTVLHVPKILLQPGELGCNTSTALAPEDNLRSPH